MKLIAAGCFESDGSWMTDGQHPFGVPPVGIERVQLIDTGVYHYHFSVPTQRDGTHKYRWFVMTRSDGLYANVQWVHPQLAIVRFEDIYTGNLDSARAHVLIVQDVPDGNADQGVVVHQTIGSDGSLLDSSGHPFGSYPSQGVRQVVVDGDGNYLIETSVDIGRSTCAWFSWYTPPNGSPILTPTSSFHNPREMRIEWRDQTYIDTALQAEWHLMLYKFGDWLPSELRITQPVGGIAVNDQPLLRFEGLFDGQWGLMSPGIQSFMGLIRPIAWSSSDPSVLEVQPDQGSVRGASAGQADLTVRYAGLEATATITVT